MAPDPSTTLLASGAADNTIKLWHVETGACLRTLDFPTAIKRVEFSEDGGLLLGVTEKRMGHLGAIAVVPIDLPVSARGGPAEAIPEQADAPSLTITCAESKPTMAGFSALSEYILAGHEDGSLSQFDARTGEKLYTVPGVHAAAVTDLQWGPDRTYFITASKDKTAKLHGAATLETFKTYVTDTPLNSAAVAPGKPYVVLGGGQAAMDVTTTATRQGKFEARLYHKVFEEEIGRVRGHFGPLNTVAVHPRGEGYASGGEDGYVRLHWFDRPYFDFMYEVERELDKEQLASL